METPNTTAAPADKADAAPGTTPPPTATAPPRLTWRKRVAKVIFRWKNIVLPLLVAIGFWLNPLVKELLQHWAVAKALDDISGAIHLGHHEPPKWRVLAVFPDPTSSTVSVPILDALGFKKGVSSQLLMDGVDFVYVPEGRSVEDTALTLRTEILKGDVLLVVGHVTSTVAQYLELNVYHSDKVTGAVPMPLILPAATNPQLTSVEPSGHEHILRLPATDVAQIKCIRSFIARLWADKKRTRDVSAAIIRDLSNPTYSEYIGDELVAEGDSVDQSVGASLGGGDIPMSSILDHDVVVVAGMERLSKVLLRRMYRRNIQIGDNPELLFTDGVAGEVFYNAANSVLIDRDAPPAASLRNQHVWMSGPFQPRDHNGASYKKGEQLPDKPDYYSYGELAGTIAKELLQKTKELHKDQLTRAFVLDTLQWWLKHPDQQPPYARFDAKGDNTLTSCHVFRIGPGKYWHSRYCCCDAN